MIVPSEFLDHLIFSGGGGEGGGGGKLVDLLTFAAQTSEQL